MSRLKCKILNPPRPSLGRLFFVPPEGMTLESRMPPIPYGPNNPHPLSQLTTELVWEGKYDEHGNRRDGIIDRAVPAF